LVTLLAAYFEKETAQHWLDRLEAAEIPCSRILTPEDSLTHEHLLARGMVVELEHPVIGIYKGLGNPLNLSRTPITYRRPAPLLGEHTEEILLELGYEENQIGQFKSGGII